MINGVLFEYFESNLSVKDQLWNKVNREAKHLEDIGITAVYLPPAFKGAHGERDVGYGVYDLYDLGEFYQKWTVGTKYGTREEYLSAIASLHQHHIDVYPDIVLNHKMGADNVNAVVGYVVKENDRNVKSKKRYRLLVPTQFNFTGRHGKYSQFIWFHEHFTGADYDFRSNQRHIYLFENKHWSTNVSKENGNYDYLMGANIDHNHKDVQEELIRFGQWYRDTTHLDGFRLDALKHIDYEFYKKWLDATRGNDELFAVGEYWDGSVDVLMEYLHHVDFRMSLFDVPLHYHFYEASRNKESYDLRNLFKDTLVSRDCMHAVTFVDNHDTSPKQGLSSFVLKWFKPMAYACILLRKDGYPCIFYGDYYGLHYSRYAGISDTLDALLRVRKLYNTGNQYDYFEQDYAGWSREGGLAVLFSLRHEQRLWMYVGKRYANGVFYDIFHPRTKVYINQDGYGEFYCRKEKLAVYIYDN